MRKIVALVVTLAVVLGAQFMARRERPSVAVTTEQIAGNPVERYTPIGSPAGVVIVAHGFAANRQLMSPWGYYLAQEGFETYIIDEPGHGASPSRLVGPGAGNDALGGNLSAILDQLEKDGRIPGGKVALVGHSMGGAAVTAAALADPRFRATVAISSAYGKAVPADRPANLLSLAADRDPANMVKAVQALALQTDGGSGQLGKQYGSFGQGTARESVIVPGRNHLTIIYDQAVMGQTAQWIHSGFGTKPPTDEPAGMPWNWVVVALVGALGVVIACGALLAPAGSQRAHAGNVRVGFFTGLVTAAVAAFSAVLACVYVRLNFLHVAVADYLLPYFLVMALVFLILRLLWPRDFGFPLGFDKLPSSVLRGIGIFLGFAGAVGPVIHMNLSNFMPTAARIFPIVVLAAGLWLYLVQEEALKRSVSADLGAWAGGLVGLISKALIVMTWLGATALPNPQTFLPLTVPVVAVLLVVLELFSYLFGLWRHSAATIAAFSALVLAWTMAVTLPLI